MQKNILITGVTSGFGKAIMEKFLTEGNRVIGIARNKEKLEEIQKKYGEKVLTRSVDLAHPESITKFFKDLPSDWKEIDILVNNAGLAVGIDLAQEAKIEDWETMINTNISALTHMTHEILPGMTKRNRGHIVNIGSISANVPYRGSNVYGATKAFVRQFSRGLRADLSWTNIRVTNIEPGKSETEFAVKRFGGDQERAKKIYEGYEYIHPEDVAEAVYFAVSQPIRVNIENIEIRWLDEAMGGNVVK